MQFKKHIHRIARIGQKASLNFAKRLGKKVAGHALIGAGAAAGGFIGGPAGSLVGGALGHEIGSSLAGEYRK